MKLTSTFSFVLLFCFHTSGQLGVDAGYTYLIEQKDGQKYQDGDKDNPYAQDQFSIGVNYQVEGWEIGLSATGLTNRQHFSGSRTSTYYDTDVGGWTSKYTTTRFRTDVEYKYAGLSVAVKKWFDFKSASWFQLGVGISQHADFLQDYKQYNTQTQTSSGTTVHYNFTDTTVNYIQTGEWQSSTQEAYSMRKCFLYLGFDIGLRFLWKDFHFEPSFGLYFRDYSRLTSDFRELEESSSFLLLDYHVLPSYSFKIGYRFGGKKAE
jgi:hypothetical protein